MTDDSFKAAMDRMLDDATADLRRRFLADMKIKYDGKPITVRRSSAFVPASLELLVDSGAITEDEARARGWTPPPRPPWRSRARWRFQAWRERAGRKLGSWIAGVDLSERDEDW